MSGKNYFAFRLILLTLDRTYYPKTSERFPVLKSTQATKPRRGFLCLTPHYELCELCGEREALVEDARSETLPMIYLPACPVLGKVSDLAVVSPISTPHITPLTFRNVGLNIENLAEVQAEGLVHCQNVIHLTIKCIYRTAIIKFQVSNPSVC